MPAFDGNTDHPCGAVGVANILVDIAEKDFERVCKALPAITNLPLVHSGTPFYTVSTPFAIGRPDEPKIRLRKKNEEQKRNLRLTLEIHCPSRGGQDNIVQAIGDGTVLMNFVNGDPDEEAVEGEEKKIGNP